MAHFAQLDTNNVVTQVIVVNNNEAPDEVTGIAFCQSLFGADIVWKQTSYNTYGGVNNREGGIPFRKNYAGIGFTYDEKLDAFIPPQPDFPSWKLNEDTCLWEAPTPMPQDGFIYNWVEADLNWQKA
jgi:hypothetical protein